MNLTNAPINVTFLIRALDYGGAQRQLIVLANSLDKTRFRITVLAFYHGELETQLKLDGVDFICLEKRGRWDLFGFPRRLIHEVRLARPAVVHGYLDIPNLLALFLKPFVGARVVWGLRAETIELAHYDWLHRLAARLERSFSRWADLIIINSEAGQKRHVSRGFKPEQLVVIPNGFDTEAFKPHAESRRQQRRAWGVQDETRLVGIVGRLDPMKDHPNFLKAAAIVCARKAAQVTDAVDVRFVCVGDGPAGYGNELQALATELGVGGKVSWQNSSGNVAAVYNALDVLVSASRAEGLPNVVGEAMACGVPCVVTDVGDARQLIGECGVVVPPQDPEALADGIIRCLSANRNEVGSQARARIEEHFSTERLATRTEEAIVRLVPR